IRDVNLSGVILWRGGTGLDGIRRDTLCRHIRSCGKRTGGSGTKSATAANASDVPGRNPQLRKTHRKLRDEICNCGKRAGGVGTKSAVTENISHALRRFRNVAQQINGFLSAEAE
ncbi:MAG: hypothetical protein LBS79_04220, partial [Tannerella sp.]|nr:hypothetical protein [Tannerella sp.]